MVPVQTSESLNTEASTSSSSSCPEWAALPRWMREALEGNPLRYNSLLPVQSAVIPYVLRGIRSCLPMDVCLSAPTGSGKTLCYLIPMLSMIGEEKRELPGDTRLRAVIVVPTKALGTQVHAVLKRLTAGTNISVACACGEVPAKESQQLVRRVRLLGAAEDSADVAEDEDDNAHDEPVATAADDEDNLVHIDASSNGVRDVDSIDAANLFPAGKTLYYSAADIVIATPQRLLKHCGTTPGFSLRHLRMLVIDEADQVLAAGANGSGVNANGTSSSNNFTNLIGRLLQLCEPAASSAASTSVHSSGVRRTAVLHKILCSATLSSHITRISEVRLRNVKQFSLATDGTALEDVDAKVVEDASGPLSHFTSRFALPPQLHEHMLTTTDERRPAILLKLIRHILSNGATSAAAAEAAAALKAAAEATTAQLDESTVVATEGEEGDATPAAVKKPKRRHDDEARPLPAPVGPHVGKTCVVFCAQSDTARVLARFLARCDVPALDFTSTSSVAERRQFVISGVSGKAVVLITTDALMRGVDLPGVGHVVMYDAPQSLPQFVHRVGRTARALREGHAYLLLTKKGPSGNLADGEVAQYKALDKYLTRSIPMVYEKGLQVLTQEDVDTADAKLQETRQTLESLLLSTASTTTAAATTTSTTTSSDKKLKQTPSAPAPAKATKRPRE